MFVSVLDRGLLLMSTFKAHLHCLIVFEPSTSELIIERFGCKINVRRNEAYCQSDTVINSAFCVIFLIIFNMIKG